MTLGAANILILLDFVCQRKRGLLYRIQIKFYGIVSVLLKPTSTPHNPGIIEYLENDFKVIVSGIKSE